ncbi:hypothetical protein MsAg5_00760 [Methanosarcinaceae archaeon Ag5]|uniref:Fido domain-containing protein n=1 Tax=Methanolapillus africanus TaxID=3028297 RepID=A0AAE4MIM2_9EURY|nr:hypothetical protein [Methanosarcinaceae archaeon Ag5]
MTIEKSFNVTDLKYFADYQNRIGCQIPSLIEKYPFSDNELDFNYLTEASAVYSSNIEGNTVDLNSFMNYKLSRQKSKEKEIEEIENLISAYKFAQENTLSKSNFLKCHELLSRTLVSKNRRGKYRNESVGVFGESGLIYLAVEPEFVKETMAAFFDEIESLEKQKKMSAAEVFYHASLIHLKCAHIHPFSDGNGRSARLLEKWFIASMMGKRFWAIESERCCKENRSTYYENIDLGVNYYELDYDKCLPFLEMLPKCLKK